MASTRHLNVDERNDALVLTVLDERLTQDVQVDGWKDEMVKAIQSRSTKGVILDMKNVEYLTSIAIFPLVATRGVAEEAGAKLVLCNLSDTVAKVLTVAQLIVESREHAQHFRIANDLDDAIELLKS